MQPPGGEHVCDRGIRLTEAPPLPARSTPRRVRPIRAITQACSRRFDPTTFASQLLWLVITFVIFYLAMSKIVMPRVGSILESRHDRIAQDLDEASRLKAEADAAVATYESELAAARAKANSIGATARDAAKAKAEDDRTAIEASLNDKI